MASWFVPILQSILENYFPEIGERVFYPPLDITNKKSWIGIVVTPRDFWVHATIPTLLRKTWVPIH